MQKDSFFLQGHQKYANHYVLDGRNVIVASNFAQEITQWDHKHLDPSSELCMTELCQGDMIFEKRTCTLEPCKDHIYRKHAKFTFPIAIHETKGNS